MRPGPRRAVSPAARAQLDALRLRLRAARSVDDIFSVIAEISAFYETLPPRGPGEKVTPSTIHYPRQRVVSSRLNIGQKAKMAKALQRGWSVHRCQKIQEQLK